MAIKKHLGAMYGNARRYNNTLIEKSLNIHGPFETLLDVGCWDGELTHGYASACSAKKVYGIEVVKEMADKAHEKGIEAFSIRADQDQWPIKDNSLDCVVSNQVVEHLSDLDHYFREASRVLKTGGFLVTSTNNLASWHNIGALLFSWAPFDLTNSSRAAIGIGNPFSVHRGENCQEASWTHKCIYTPRWLFEWQKLYKMEKINHFGAGLYPFPASWGNVFKNHAAFMIITTKKIRLKKLCLKSIDSHHDSALYINRHTNV